MDSNKSSNFDLLSIGDATVDIFLTLQKNNDKLHLDKEKNELCVQYGEKILVEDSQFMLGGNACNVAVGAARLKFNCAFVSELGDDEFANVIFKGLQKENVSPDFINKTAGLGTNFAVILTFEHDKVLFARHLPRNHEFSFENVSTKWVYLTSMGKEWKQAYQKTLDYVRKTGAKLAFNPGTTQIEEGFENFKEAVALSDILFVNKQEALEIFNFNPPAPIVSGPAGGAIFNEETFREILLKIKEKGPKVVVITDNNNGSYAVDENGKIYHIEVFPGVAIQKTGAGDAYTSGFISARIDGKDVKEAMKWGAINAAFVVQKIGAQAGLLSREEIERKLGENQGFQAKEISQNVTLNEAKDSIEKEDSSLPLRMTS
ncbi:carbohydrate kinase family protein [Candidatus Microgenomates bacterium]|nr:MAG: carbohydrate kinase family protein [Candidatus Microgenomates bacterium]